MKWTHALNYRLLGWLVLSAGAVVRVLVYLQDRSLFLDEANLAWNIAYKDWQELFAVLDHHQYAPPLFLLGEKAAWQVFGATEYALRLLPLLAGIASLWLLYRIGRYFLENRWLAWFPVWMVAFGAEYIRYSSEVKQYSTDLFICLLLIFLALRSKPAHFSRGDFARWSVLGATAIWFSMPAVFGLAGVGLYFFSLLVTPIKKADLLRLSATIACWLASFGLYYYLLLLPDLQTDYLQGYHQAYFLDLWPADWQEARGTLELLNSLLRSATGFTLAAEIAGGAFLAGGMIVLWKERRRAGLLLLVPVACCLLASALRQYSLIERLTLFFIPLLIVVVAIGFDGLLRGDRRWRWPVVLTAIALLASLRTGYRYAWEPLHVEEIKPALRQLAAMRTADQRLLVYGGAVPAYRFYTETHRDSLKYRSGPAFEMAWGAGPDGSLLRAQGLAPGDEFWILYTRQLSAYERNIREEQVGLVRTFSEQKRHFTYPGGNLYLFRLRSLQEQ